MSNIEVMYLKMVRKSAFVCSHHLELGQVYFKQVNNHVVKQVSDVFWANYMF